MAVTKTNELRMKVRYDDYATRNYTLPNVSDDALDDAKTKIIEFNAALADTSSAKRTAYRDTFIHYDDETKTSSPIAEIASASYVETEEEVVYGG